MTSKVTDELAQIARIDSSSYDKTDVPVASGTTTCTPQWLFFDWTNTGSKDIQKLTILYGQYGLVFDNGTNTQPIISLTYATNPATEYTPQAPAEITFLPIRTISSQNIDTRYDTLVFRSTEPGNEQKFKNVKSLRITWEGIKPSGPYNPQLCVMDVAAVAINGVKHNPSTPTTGVKVPNLNDPGSGGLSPGAMAAIILVPLCILVPVGVLFWIRQRNIAKRKAAAYLRAGRVQG
ncbi:hypothetical protein HDV05_004059 [Chytridiales sp. JEL 0842]|nr:hypothetical protein HDV05_004059 [Chytridiales sp. JEL 0842]